MRSFLEIPLPAKHRGTISDRSRGNTPAQGVGVQGGHTSKRDPDRQEEPLETCRTVQTPRGLLDPWHSLSVSPASLLCVGHTSH